MIAILIKELLAASESQPPSQTLLYECLTATDPPEASIETVDQPLTPALASMIVSWFSAVTPKGAEAVRRADTLFAALEIALGDKGFKSSIRSFAQKHGHLNQINFVIREAASLHSWNSRRKKEKTLDNNVSKVSSESKTASNAAYFSDNAQVHTPSYTHTSAKFAYISPKVALLDSALRPSIVPHPALKKYNDVSVSFETPKGLNNIKFDQVLPLLSDPTYEKLHSSILLGLSSSPARLSILILDRAVRSGRLKLEEQLASKLHLAAIRLYSSLNANRTAHDFASKLEASSLVNNLPAGERLKLKFLVARAKVRTGQAEEASRLYRKLMIDNPHRTDAVIQYILSIFANKPLEATSLASFLLDNNRKMSFNDRIFLGEVCRQAGDRSRATRAFLDIACGDVHSAEGLIGLANCARLSDDNDAWSDYLISYGVRVGLELVSIASSSILAPFRFRAPRVNPISDHPKIAVVMTSFNAASTIEAAATSVLSQSLSNLELWIVDDVSTDGTIEIARSLAERDPRVRVLLNEQNIGTYASKNRALRLTDAEYVALHDSDDWKHPKKLELQLAALEGGKACSISNWIRMDANGEVYVRRGGPYTHLNPASTFMPRSLLQNTGFFDEVRTGADAEFLTRIRNSVGWSNVIDTGKTLAIGLHHEASLTTSGATAFDEHRYSPVRLEYTEAWLEWQLQKLEAGEQVKLEPFSRPFVVPSSILATNIIG